MSDPILIYGASGYSGRLATRACLAASVRPILAGRSADVIASAAASDGLEQRAFDLSDPERLDAALEGIRVVLNMAGPYSRTAHAMVEACLRTGTHYLDVTGETQVVEDLARLDRQCHVVHGDQPAEAAHQVGDLQQRHSHASLSMPRDSALRGSSRWARRAWMAA
jgi:short subunit dehydrogenase-like uncharacterized protein